MTLDPKIESTSENNHQTCIYPPPPIPATAREIIKNVIDGASPHRMVPEPEKSGSVEFGKLTKQHRVQTEVVANSLRNHLEGDSPKSVNASNIAPFRPSISARRPDDTF